MKILVAGISVRAMVESAVRSGYPVIALDAFGDLDLRRLAESYSLHQDFRSRYSPQALERACRTLRYDAIAYTSSLENHPDILQRMAGRRPIIGNSPDSIRSARSWTVLFSKLSKAGFPVPVTLGGSESCLADPGRRWLAKPVLSGGGKGIRFWHASEPQSLSHILQEYLPGKSCSASFVANGNDCVVVGITLQLIGLEPFGSKGFQYCGNILPLPESLDPEKGPSILEQVRRLAAFLTREYRLAGMNGIDFILDGDRVIPVEINPRYSASMELMEWAYGLPIFKLHVQAALDGTLPEFRLESSQGAAGFFGKAIVYAGMDARAPDTRQWIGGNIRDIPLPGERFCVNNPVCTVLANQTTCEKTLADLIRRAAWIKEQIHG
ncbi:MAG: ATP-grasp domain-containing protein [Acidobacteriota bacterium]|nr:ATP-grasp domain-containing protein [Acidobacteriota bacterium]